MNIHTNPYVYVSDVVFVFTSAELVRTCFPSLMTLITYIAEPPEGLKKYGGQAVFVHEIGFSTIAAKTWMGRREMNPLDPKFPPGPVTYMIVLTGRGSGLTKLIRYTWIRVQ